MFDDFEAVRPDDDVDAEERERLIDRRPDPDEPETWASDFRPYLDDPA